MEIEYVCGVCCAVLCLVMEQETGMSEREIEREGKEMEKAPSN